MTFLHQLCNTKYINVCVHVHTLALMCVLGDLVVYMYERNMLCIYEAIAVVLVNS